VSQCVVVCRSVLQCVETLTSVNSIRCVAVCCSVLQSVACAQSSRHTGQCRYDRECVAVCSNVLQCVAVCCSVLQCVAVSYCVLQYVAVCEDSDFCQLRQFFLTIAGALAKEDVLTLDVLHDSGSRDMASKRRQDEGQSELRRKSAQVFAKTSATFQTKSEAQIEIARLARAELGLCVEEEVIVGALGYSVDAWLPDYNVCIEFDGPTHFVTDLSSGVDSRCNGECVFVCLCVCVFVCVLVWCVFIHIFVCVCIMYMYVRTHTYIHTYLNTYVYAFSFSLYFVPISTTHTHMYLTYS